jgi:acetyl esterase/lipase
MKSAQVLALICFFPAVFCVESNGQDTSKSSRATTILVGSDRRPAAASMSSSMPVYSFEKLGAITYRVIDGEPLKCDVYVPDGPGPYPAVLAIHGGAWRNGSKFYLLRHAWKMARAGYVVVAINYRHAPEYPFPAQIHDCKYAVRWMRLNAEKYKIDSQQIAAFGYSAGGHLACLLGTTDPEDGLEPELSGSIESISSEVQAVVAGGAPCEFDWIDKESTALKYWLGERRCDAPEIYERASPTTYATSDDPPTYFFHGDLDWVVPKQTSQRLFDQLSELGVRCRHDVAKNRGHFSTFNDLSWMKRGIAFLDSVFKRADR